MFGQKYLSRIPLAIVGIGISLAIGLFIPVVYRIVDGSRIYGREKKLLNATLIVLLITFVATVIWMWLRKKQGIVDGCCIDERPRQKFQFGIRELLIAMTISAALVAILPLMKVEIARYVILAFLFAIAGTACTPLFNNRQRSNVFCLLACMYVPYFWLIVFNKPFGHTSGLLDIFPTSPPFLIGVLLGQFIFKSRELAEVALCVLVLVQLAAGVWSARRGGKINITYMVGSLVLSSLGSMVLHVLYRA